jgi:hypothetical protein
MSTALLNEAVLEAVERAVKIITPEDESPEKALSLEFDRLRYFHENSLPQHLAARAALLINFGYQRSDVASEIGVSRVTLSKWLDDNTRGADTFKQFFDSQTPEAAAVLAPVTSLLTPSGRAKLSGLRFAHDKFLVPEGFVEPLQVLWRVAYRARGPENTKDVEIAAASNALDVLISLLLRRGVTNLAIAHAAGVTHRAVLDRMKRARARGLLLKCGEVDESCEAFFGEDDVKRAFSGGPSSAPGLAGRWIDSGQPLALVRTSSTHPNKFWLQTLVESDGRTALYHTPSTPYDKKAAQFELAGFDPDKVLTCSNELTVALAIGRLNPDSSAAVKLAESREGAVLVSASLLYTTSSKAAGVLPENPVEAVSAVPRALWDEYFAPYDKVKDCFFKTDEVVKDFKKIARHAPWAETRANPEPKPVELDTASA